jgi:hypothetical protein
MTALATLATAGAVALGAVAAPVALAADVTVIDASGDTMSRGLDITGATLDNADYALSTTVNFRTERAGEVIVGLKAREQRVIRLVSIHKADGGGRDFLIDSQNEVIACRGLEVTWDDDPATVSFEVPSRCLWRGKYGAVKAWYLTEGARGGGDVDYAPEEKGDLRYTDWVARG